MTGNLEKSKWLLSQGAPLIDQGHCGMTNLMYSVHNDHAEQTSWLIDQGADIDATDDFGDSALMHAAERGAEKCLRLLIDRGVGIHAIDQLDDEAINHASTPGAVRLLKDAGADIDRIGGDGYCLLKTAAESGNVEMAKALLLLGANVATTSTGDTALHAAVKTDELEIIQLLLKAGADPNACDVDGWTPLMFVRSVEAARELIQRGANTGIQDDIGETAIDKQDDLFIRAFLSKSS